MKILTEEEKLQRDKDKALKKQKAEERKRKRIEKQKAEDSENLTFLRRAYEEKLITEETFNKEGTLIDPNFMKKEAVEKARSIWDYE